MLLDKTGLHFVADLQERLRRLKIPATFSKMHFLPRSDLPPQILDLNPQITQRTLDRLQKLSRVRDRFFRGNQSHVCSFTSCQSDPRHERNGKRPQGCPYGRVPTSSSMSQLIRETVRNVKLNRQAACQTAHA